MFEKSLYDLIRGLRNHKGSEREYIQNSLRECRMEIRSQDMDVKAIALLKLIYLEMFGHDMSWASFHVLEVMSSAKSLQKRVGYLGAVQSFRPDTEVLMLATNLLQKDLTSPLPQTISLPLVTIPHIITPSLATSLLSDLLPRLTHTHPMIRKKTIVTLYRLALVYPETLRPAWPKIKERLMDEQEDSSVTAAIVNVVCELGWRRPQDFLPLAPRLFDLLVDGGNNWMAIKIIKLFATLTPLEPRLVKKLLPPLTSLIRTTPAMSVLYECINGIILGGILEGAEGTSEGEEIASLCVGKLRGMIIVEDDPNLRYVALLAFNKIVCSHAHLVSQHQDVILNCIDDADISIRLRTLDLAVCMVNKDNLTSIVGRLMRQLRNSPTASGADDPLNDRALHHGVEPAADSDDENLEENLRPAESHSEQAPPLPDDYRVTVIIRILEMCSRDTYANMVDFEWYVDILTQLVRYAPVTSTGAGGSTITKDKLGRRSEAFADPAKEIGMELLNVAVRVRAVRSEVTRAAERLLVERDVSAHGPGGNGCFGFLVWISGEYADYLANPDDTLTALLHPSSATLGAESLSLCLQAILKIYAELTGVEQAAWNPARKTMVTLLTARVVHFLEKVISHPNLEVQERAVELFELFKLAAEAISGQDASPRGVSEFDTPMMLTHAVPSLFRGLELNPVAPSAQGKVPLPEGLDLEQPINPSLPTLLEIPNEDFTEALTFEERGAYYNEPPQNLEIRETAAKRLDASTSVSSSYQQQSPDDYLDEDILARRRAERHQRNKDDPYYIPTEETDSGTSTPFHNIIKITNGTDLDIDSIPIMDLNLEPRSEDKVRSVPSRSPSRNNQVRNAVAVTVDETIPSLGGPSEDAALSQEPTETSGNASRAASSKLQRSLLQVDSSGIGSFSFEDDNAGPGDEANEHQRHEHEDEEMAKALKEVERLRLEMQRASERIEAAKGIPLGGTLVKKKKKKKSKPVIDDVMGVGTAHVATSIATEEGDLSTKSKKKRKKKKKKQVVDIEDIDAVVAEG